MRTGWIFPGQGSQRVRMASAVLERSAAARRVFAEASESIGLDLEALCRNGPFTSLTATENAQPAIVTCSVACAAMLAESGHQPAVLVGHSVGEFSALVAAGALPLASAIRAVRRRGQLMASVSTAGSMLAVMGLDEARVAVLRDIAAEDGVLAMALHNGPSQFVLSGCHRALKRFKDLADANGAKECVLLDVSHAFHSPLMGAIVDDWRSVVEGLDLDRPRYPVILNTTARTAVDVGCIQRSLIDQVTMPVLWTQCVRALVSMGVTNLIEVGDSKVVGSLARRVEPSLTVTTLHESELPPGPSTRVDGASQGSGEVRTTAPEPQADPFEPIAIVGLGVVCPGSRGVEAFWAQVQRGTSAIREMSEVEFNSSAYYDADRSAVDRSYCKYAALLEHAELDFRRHKIPPKLALDMHRTQIAFLDATSQALDDAQASMKGVPRERIGFVLGSLGGGLRPDTRVRTRMLDMMRALRASPTLATLGSANVASIPEDVERQINAEISGITEDEAIASFSSVWVGRAAKLFNLRGPHTALDAGYASSLAAIQTASHQLRAGDCDVVLAGGCSQLLTPHDLIAFSKLGGLAAQSLVPFDARADGTILGEGVGIFVLRRLRDAIATGERIYAVIRGVGAASDGRGKSLLAPNSRGQVLAMRRAYAQAGYAATSVQYVECHGTGTPLGDLTEFQGLSEVFGARTSGPRVRLGSVKELTGHLQAAAGAAGLMKATLALYHAVLPAQHSFRRPADGIDLEHSPFEISDRNEAWPGSAAAPRRASVSSFSFGGLSYHLTLEAYSPEYHRNLSTVAPGARYTGPLAIVGLGGVFPRADDVKQLWDNILQKRCAVGEIPPERAPIDRYLDISRSSKVRPYTNLAGYIVDGRWPQERIRIPPKVGVQIDRGHSWTLRAALQSLDDAGSAAHNIDPRRVGIVMGYLPPLEREFQTQARVYYAEFDSRLAEQLRRSGVDAATAVRIRIEAEEFYKQELPPITEDTLLGYMGSLAAARVAHHLGFQGPAFMVESACASSMAGLDVAINQLRTRACDMMLVGGMYASLGVDALSQCCSFGGLSQKGSFPFDARADGYITSEGACVLTLKRLADAEAAGDRIYAVVRSVAGATDPKSASIWAPSSEGQVQAVRRAVEKAGASATQVQFIEGHGTGTPVGDPIEVETYQEVYGRESKGTKILLGSVKSNVGHLNSAAGAVALTKVALALHHKVFPPNIGFETPNPRIPWRDIALRVPTECEPWNMPVGGVRRAGVTSFGLGGTSFHAILEAYQPATSVIRRDPPDIAVQPSKAPHTCLRFAGADRSEILAQVQQLASRLELDANAELRPRAPAGAPCRFAMTLQSGRSARQALGLARQMLAGAGAPSLPEQGLFYYDIRDTRQLHRGRVAVLFPGQGPQYANMLRALSAEYSIIGETFSEADRIFATMADGRRLSETFWVPPAAEATYSQSDETVHAAVFLANVALYRLIRAHGIRIDVLLGQSAGEYAALVAGGILSLEDGLRAIYRRTLAVINLPGSARGRMASISGDLDAVRRVLAEAPAYVTLAAENAPGQGIVAGEDDGVEFVMRWCAANGLEARVLPVSHAYHTKLIAGAAPAFRAELQRLSWRAPVLPVLSSVHGRYYPPAVEPGFMARHLALQYVQPLDFVRHVRTLHDDGVRFFVESGPKWSLTAFVQTTLAGRPYLAQASSHPKVGEVEQFRRLLAFSYVHRLLQEDEVSRGEEHYD